MKKISLTLEDIEAVIVKKEFMQVMATTLTICVLTLENGFTVTGESACVDPNNFDKDIGEKIAYENAREKIWQLEGYLLMSRLHNAEEGAQGKGGGIIDEMTFGIAIEMLKKGEKVARKGWNGKGMFIILVNGTNNVKPFDGTPYKEVCDFKDKTEINILPHIDMYSATDEMVVGWLASQTDMLAEDWVVVV